MLLLIDIFRYSRILESSEGDAQTSFFQWQICDDLYLNKKKLIQNHLRSTISIEFSINLKINFKFIGETNLFFFLQNKLVLIKHKTYF